MNSGLQSTIAGVLLTAILAGISYQISDSKDQGIHLAKIDTVLENQANIMKEIKSQSSEIPAPVEEKLSEIRERLNLHEQRINKLEK